jgi:hypothetical protein
MATTKIITLDELRANKSREKFYILVHGKGTLVANQILYISNLNFFFLPVYDVTKFMDEVCHSHQSNYIHIQTPQSIAPRRR